MAPSAMRMIKRRDYSGAVDHVYIICPGRVDESNQVMNATPQCSDRRRR